MNNKPQQHLKDWKIPRLWLWNTVFWVVLWSFSVYNNFQWALSARAPFSWDMVFSWSFPYYLVMLLSGPIIIVLYDRWRNGNYWSQGLRHLTPALIAGFLHQFALNIFYVHFHPVAKADTSRDLMEKFLLRYEVGSIFSANGFLFYWLCIGLLLGIDLYNRSRHQQMANLTMSAELNKARFQALQNQLQPHFLFNAFNSLSMMARQEKHKEVVDMISRLSNLLRETLKLGDDYKITLAREIELIQLYLDIEAIRFRDRLSISIDVPETLKPQPVPALLLQPLVENCFLHGISKVETKAYLNINITAVDNRMRIEIANAAPALSRDWNMEANMGIGLSNVINRLELGYEQDYQFSISNSADGTGVLTLIDIPLE